MQRATWQQVKATYKPRDAWWTVFLVDPLAAALLRLASPWRFVTPNGLTVVAFLLGLGAAACFWTAEQPLLMLGAALFYVSFTLDCMDGKLARLRGTGSLFGGWLDYILDRIRVLACTLALFGGQYAATGNAWWWVLAVAVVFCDLFRYLNALYLKEMRREMRDKLAAVAGVHGGAVQLQDEAELEIGAAGAAPDKEPESEAETDSRPGSDAGEAIVVDAQVSFKRRFSRFAAFRDALVRRRVRSHVFSGVEFQMFVFIVAPLTSLVAPVTIGAAALLLLVEAAVTYKQYLSAADVQSQLKAGTAA